MIAKFTFGRLARKTPAEHGVPVLRRADSHPDAPARRPIRAAEDLGQPLPMRVTPPLPVKRPTAKPEALDLPADLETPLAALDPAAIPVRPREPVRPVASLRPQIIDPGERFETFELTPIKRVGLAKVTTPRVRSASKMSEPPASIGALLDRLEKKTGRDIHPRTSIEETLGMLRGLAPQ